MALPTFNKCFGCIDLRKGSISLTGLSIIACGGNIAVHSLGLQKHQLRTFEDNLISTAMIMFSALSGVSNIVIMLAILCKRSNWLQYALFFNAMFIVYAFLVAVVTCFCSPEIIAFVSTSPVNIIVVLLSLLAGIAYCIYFLLVVNSYYHNVKQTRGDSVIPL